VEGPEGVMDRGETLTFCITCAQDNAHMILQIHAPITPLTMHDMTCICCSSQNTNVSCICHT